MGPRSCPETSVRIYHYALCKFPREGGSVRFWYLVKIYLLQNLFRMYLYIFKKLVSTYKDLNIFF